MLRPGRMNYLTLRGTSEAGVLIGRDTLYRDLTMSRAGGRPRRSSHGVWSNRMRPPDAVGGKHSPPHRRHSECARFEEPRREDYFSRTPFCLMSPLFRGSVDMTNGNAQQNDPKMNELIGKRLRL
jgi:hypothetical protein